MRLLTVFFALLITTNAQAGFTKGNGGNILLCDGTPNIVLDFFEITELHKLTPAKDLEDPLFFESIQDKLAKINPSFAQSYATVVKSLSSRVRFLNNRLESVNDSYTVIIPVNCEIFQTAVQVNGRVLIDSELYSVLSPTQQKTLLLHEALYTAILSRRTLDDSRPVRALVSLLLSNEFLNMSRVDLNHFLSNNNIYIND